MQYDTILDTARKAKIADERNTALRSLGRAQSPELIKRTLALSLSDEVKEQDIYLPLAGLRTHPGGIQALYDWMTSNWDTLVKKLPPALSMLGTVVSLSTNAFSKKEDEEKVKAFFAERDTKGFERALAQSLDAIRAKEMWLARDRSDVESWVKENGYAGKVKSEL